MADKGITSRIGCEQGFVGKSGKFYTREEAVTIAIAAGQIPKDHKGTLNSEHLWPLTSVGKSTWDD